MFGEDGIHLFKDRGVLVQMAGVQGEAVLDVVLLVAIRVAGRAKVNVLDALLRQRRPKGSLREALAPR